jgi:hypothetical protein
VDIAVPVGKRIPTRSLNWLQSFAQEQNRMLLYSEQIEESRVFTNKQRVIAYGPPEFQQEFTERFSSGEFSLHMLIDNASQKPA